MTATVASILEPYKKEVKNQNLKPCMHDDATMQLLLMLGTQAHPPAPATSRTAHTPSANMGSGKRSASAQRCEARDARMK